MTKLSDVAWAKAEPLIKAINMHPFNLQMSSGELATDKFAYYIEQDTVYLQSYARCLAMIAARAPLNFAQDFLRFSEKSLDEEQMEINSSFLANFDSQNKGKLTSATISYTSYILQAAAAAPVEVAIAAILPCFWVYKEIGLSMAENVDPDNPYMAWIDTYSNEAFCAEVDRAIEIFDEVAMSASESVRDQMVDAFYKSTALDWHFWNDSYNQEVFDDLVLNEF